MGHAHADNIYSVVFFPDCLSHFHEFNCNRAQFVKIAENTVLVELGRLIETITDLGTTSDIYDCIVKFIPRVLPADHVTISHYCENEGSIRVLAQYDVEDFHIEMTQGEKMKSYTSYEAYAHSVAKPIIYKPTDNLDRKINRMLHSAGVTSILIVPLISGLEIVGTINIASRYHDFVEQDKFRLEKISALLATSITHTVAFQSNGQIKRHRLYARHLEYLNGLSEKLLAAESFNDALVLVSNCAKRLCNADRVSFCEIDVDPKYVRIIGLAGNHENNSDVCGTRVLLEESGLGDSLVHGRKSYSTDLLNSKNKSQRSLGESGFNHIWSFPIICADEPKRCLNIVSVSTELNIDDTMSVLNTLARLTHSTLERINAQMKTVRQAKTDPLTGLCNRKELNEQLTLAISENSAYNDTCVMFLDLDMFKNINDTMGHSVGDRVLLGVSARVKNLLQPQDTLARIGGDEFMIVLTRMSMRESADVFAQKLIQSIQQPFCIEGHDLSVGVSIGICNFPEHGTDANELMKNADMAMYKAKDIGRNQFYSFTEELANEINYRSLLKKELAVALKNDAFSLVYQPQLNINTLQVESVEVLLRWHHDTLGTISPGVFIPLAENSGIIGAITDWVLNKALADMVQWQKKYPALKLAVNISALEFSPQLNLLERLKNAVESSGIDASDLEIELTETAFLKHPEHAVELANQLSDIGMSIALDDFGTGYASLTYLVQLPINRIKIDRSFIDSIEVDEKKQAVIKGILAIANGLNVPCLGEGVETQAQLDWLKSANCDSAQGFLLSKPIAVGCLSDVMENFNREDSYAA